MLKLGNATLKYLNFIDIVSQTQFDLKTLDNDHLLKIKSYIYHTANVDLDIVQM